MNEIARELYNRVRALGYDSSIISSEESVNLHWSCYCVSCRVTVDSVIVTYLPQKTTPQLFTCDLDGIPRVVNQIMAYIQLELVYDKEFYGDAID